MLAQLIELSPTYPKFEGSDIFATSTDRNLKRLLIDWAISSGSTIGRVIIYLS
jgi:hypothetical protein